MSVAADARRMEPRVPPRTATAAVAAALFRVCLRVSLVMVASLVNSLLLPLGDRRDRPAICTYPGARLPGRTLRRSGGESRYTTADGRSGRRRCNPPSVPSAD